MSQRIVQEHHSIFNFSAVYDKVLEEMRKNIDILVLFLVPDKAEPKDKRKSRSWLSIKENYDLLVVPR